MGNSVYIDGCNVAECEFFKRNRGFDCFKGLNCSETDCYFKQLQRAKAENEKLKNALIEIKVNFINQSARNGLSKFENEIFIKIDKVLSP